MEGSAKGFDVELVRAVANSVPIPVIASGGMGSTQDLINVVNNGCADAVAMAHVLHYKKMTVQEVREKAVSGHVNVRRLKL